MASDSSPTSSSLGAKAIEHGAAERRTRHGLTIVYTGNGKGKTTADPRIPMDDHAAAAAHGWQVARTIVSQGQYDVVVLDEVLAAVTAGLVPLDELVEVVRSKPSQLHLVLTGRNAPAELIEVADLVSEVQPIKHPFDKGIKAQRGIEF